MSKTTVFRNPLKRREPSFTLIELLTVMAIIALLAGLILAAGNGILAKASRSRATAEISAMGTALESYKTDNGIYVAMGTVALFTNSPGYSGVDVSSAGGLYQQSSQLLYEGLSGQTNFLDTPTGAKVYMAFKANQLGNAKTAAGTGASATTSTYVKDPFGNSYGYSSGTITNAPYNGVGFFDLWSTGGKTGTTAANTNSWIPNWQ
jgi:prepilin-type N-terminal cleavage/methylation domain-containing protein